MQQGRFLPQYNDTMLYESLPYYNMRVTSHFKNVMIKTMMCRWHRKWVFPP